MDLLSNAENLMLVQVIVIITMAIIVLTLNLIHNSYLVRSQDMPCDATQCNCLYICTNCRLHSNCMMALLSMYIALDVFVSTVTDYNGGLILFHADIDLVSPRQH